MAINKPDTLYSKVIEVAERVTLESWTESKKPTPIDIASDSALVEGVTGEVVRILEPLGTSDAKFTKHYTDVFQTWNPPSSLFKLHMMKDTDLLPSA